MGISDHRSDDVNPKNNSAGADMLKGFYFTTQNHCFFLSMQETKISNNNQDKCNQHISYKINKNLLKS